MKFSHIILSSFALLLAHAAIADNIEFDPSRQLIVKLNAGITSTNGKLKGLPAPTSTRGVAAPQTVPSLISKGASFTASSTLFFTDFLASELAFNLNAFRSRSSSAIAHNYSDTSIAQKRRLIYIAPMSVALQYYVAPYGAVRPYLGGGYSYGISHAQSKNFTVSNASGVMVQAGVNLVNKDDTIINLDVKQYIMSAKVKYKNNIVAKPVTAKMKLNPITVSIGVGYNL